MDHAPSCPPGGPRRAMRTCSGQSGWSQRVSGAARPPRRPHELLRGRATSCAATRTLATDLLSRAAGTADWPLATAGGMARARGMLGGLVSTARPTKIFIGGSQTRPHRIRCKSAPRGAAREMWHRGSGAHMRSRGRNAATAAGGRVGGTELVAIGGRAPIFRSTGPPRGGAGCAPSSGARAAVAGRLSQMGTS